MLTPDFLGTLPGWITSASVVTLLGMLLRHHIQHGRLTLDDRAQKATSEAAIRDHYAQEVNALRGQLDRQSKSFREDLASLEKQWRDLLREAEERHEQCLKDRDALRERVSDLEDELRGLIRLITQASVDRVLMLGEDIPADVRHAAQRVEALIKEKGRK